MAAINSGGTYNGVLTITGTYAIKALTSVNLQASHTLMFRVKHALATTTYGSIMAGYSRQSVSASFQGSIVGRFNGDSSTSVRCYRQNDNASPTRDSALATTAYGNTTTWYHVTMAYDAPNAIIRTYVDGVASATVASVTTRPVSSTANNITGLLHQGKFADFAYFNRLLTPSEISDMASYRTPQITSGLTLFWRLDANLNDSSGNANNGTTGGSGSTITFSTADNPPQDETNSGAAATGSALAGQMSAAIIGPASSTSALAGKASALVTGTEASTSALAGLLTTVKPITGAAASTSALSGAMQAALKGAAASSSALNAWIRPRWGRRANTNSSLVNFDSFSAAAPWTIMTWRRSITLGAGQAQFIAFDSASGAVRLGASGGTYTMRMLDSTGAQTFDYTAADDGQWHHMAMSFDGTTARAYLDGALVASGNPSLSGTYNTFQWGGGASALTEYAHTKIWTAQLSAADIASEATYYTPHTALASLYAWWQLSWQNVTLDSSGNGHTLTDFSSPEAQTESPGQPMAPISGSAASTSSAAAALNTLKPITGAAATSSSLAASLTSLLTGAAASSSVLAGQLTSRLTGNASTTSALAGTLAAQIAAAANSTSTLVGALQWLLTGSPASTSALTGTLAVAGQFAGNAATASALNNAALSINAAISGSAATASALAGALQALIRSDAATASTLSGQLSALLTANPAATSSALQGALNAAISGPGASSSALTGALLQLQSIQGALASASNLAAALSVAITVLVSGNSASASALAGGLTIFTTVKLASAAASNSQLAGLLGVLVPAAATGGDTVTGSSTTVFYIDGTAGPIMPIRRWPPRPR